MNLFFFLNHLFYLQTFPSNHAPVMGETKGHAFNTVNCQLKAGEHQKRFCAIHRLLLRCPGDSSIVEASAGKCWDRGAPYAQNCGFCAVYKPRAECQQKYMDDYRV